MKIKDNVRVVAVGNVVLPIDTQLSAYAQDGKTFAAQDRVGLVNQDNAAENGIYVFWPVSGDPLSGRFVRALDANTREDIQTGMQFSVDEGDTLGGTTWRLTTEGAITPDSTELTFVDISTHPATESAAGLVAKASDVEADAGTGDAKFITPADLLRASTAAKARANHTGTQAAATIIDFNTAADARAAMATNVFRVGNRAPYATIQAAVDAAELSNPSLTNQTVVLIPPGRWDEDVVVRRSYVHFFGLGGQGAVRIRSLTYTNCTAASILAYATSDDPADLVAETQIGIPVDNQVRFIELWNQESNAQASLRILGAGAATSFMGGEELLIDSTVRASGPSQDGRAIDAVLANYISTGGYCWVFGETRLRNCAGFWPLGAQMGAVVVDYDSAAEYDQPSDEGNYGLSGKGSFFTGAITLTNEGRIGGDPAVGHTFESSISATGIGASALKNCHLLGAVTLGLGTVLTLDGGTLMEAPTGAGTFTRNAAI